ncbi:HU family DNA-binding protein [bacterium]|jgi:DNA-binding protein HU-beta|nr:HU family DNA-binding protein [bacterium]
MAKNTTVSTSQLVAAVADKFTQLPKKVTKEVIADFLATVEGEVASGRKLRIDKVGILQVKERAARMGRNPQTGEEIRIPASKKIAFRAAKSLKEQVTGAKKGARTTKKAAPAKKKKK